MALSDLNKLGSLSGGNNLKSLNKLGGVSGDSGLSRLNTLGSIGSKKETSKTEQLLETSQFKQEFKPPVTGEKPDKFLSGGFVMDTFDWLNMLSYGTVGVLQGKGFSEGVRTRASFAEKEALGKYGWAGTIAGIGLDVATDPLTYIPIVGVINKFGKATKLSKVAKKAQDAFVKTKIGKGLGENLVYRFGQDPVYKEIAERRIRNAGVQQDAIVEMAQPIIKQDKKVREIFTTKNEAGQTIRRGEEEVKTLLDKINPKDKNKIFSSFKSLSDEIDKLTNKMVEAKILPEDVKENLGKYLNNQFMVHEGKANKFVSAEKVGLDTNILKKRKDISEEVREQLGQIIDAGYLLPETAMKMIRTVENAKFMDDVVAKFAVDEAADGFLKMPEGPKWGSLSGKYVPEFIQKDLVDVFKTVDDSAFKDVTKKVVGTFKFGKVILNPATHFRNIMSNFVLNSFEGMNPLDPRAMNAYRKAAMEVAKKGDIYKEAKALGLGVDTFAAQEIKSLLKEGGKLEKLSEPLKKAGGKVADMYEKEEQFAKLAQYIFQKETKGLSPEEAWKVAERATFNYAQVTPFIRNLRESIFGYPFLTFTYKATPQVAKTLVTKPGRISVYGKIKEGIEERVPESEREQVRANEPQWVKDGFYIQLPGKDKNGRNMLFDATYLLPFGDLVSGQIINRGINSDTGYLESIPTALTEKLPFINLVVELNQNRDFYGNKIFKESDDEASRAADIARHIFKFMAPPLVGELAPGGTRESGERRESSYTRVFGDKGIEGAGKQTRTPTQEILRQFGLKVDPVDIANQNYWADALNDKAIKTFLKEKGDVSEMDILYRKKE